MKKFQEFVNEIKLKEKESWWGKKGKDRVSARRAQWAKQGLLKKKSKPEPPEKKEKDSGIRRAAKKAGMSSKERKGLYNQNDLDERLMSGPQKVAQMQHYWDNLDHMASDERKKKNMQMRFGIRNIKLDPRNKNKILSFDEEITNNELESIMDNNEERDYKDEYKKFQSTKKAIKYRAELNKYNRKKGTYGNGDGKDASHKNGKIVGFEDESINRGRREKSRLKVNETFKSFEEYFYEAGDERMDKYVSDEIKKRKLARFPVNATDDYQMKKGKPTFKFPSPTGSMMIHVWLRPMAKPAKSHTKAFNYQLEEK